MRQSLAILLSIFLSQMCVKAQDAPAQKAEPPAKPAPPAQAPSTR